LTNKISDKDKKDWEKFISSKEKIKNKDSILNLKTLQKSKYIDLHGYTLEEANIKIEKLIIDSHLEKIKKIIVVTGKGLHSQNEKNPYVSKDLSILKYSIPEFIKSNPSLMKLINKIEEASIEDGGSGAFYIYLKKI
jgi:DNA-nicking Smr family endonuclease|tara:strand:+ start:94 stop:504 length:411 start_codon:yes stop_codon:yes gene_type:complete